MGRDIYSPHSNTNGLKRLSLLLSFALLSTVLYAGAPPPPPPPPLGIPIDAGSVLMVIAGALLGGYQLYKKFASTKVDNSIG